MQEVILAEEIYIHCGTHVFSGSILSEYPLPIAAQTSRLGLVESRKTADRQPKHSSRNFEKAAAVAYGQETLHLSLGEL